MILFDVQRNRIDARQFSVKNSNTEVIALIVTFDISRDSVTGKLTPIWKSPNDDGQFSAIAVR